MNYAFENRKEAGQKLAEALMEFKNSKDAIVLALPRGGVPIAFEVAQALSLPLDVLLVRKLGVPGHEELAMGAVALNNIYYINQDVVEQLSIKEKSINEVLKKEEDELLRRNDRYRDNLPPPDVEGKTVIVIDDGIATGATMRVAIAVLHHAKAANIIVAAPVGVESTCRELEADADEVVCLHTPEPFFGVGQWYNDFSQITDREVKRLLENTLASQSQSLKKKSGNDKR